jgi:hypothetical protein
MERGEYSVVKRAMPMRTMLANASDEGSVVTIFTAALKTLSSLAYPKRSPRLVIAAAASENVSQASTRACIKIK